MSKITEALNKLSLELVKEGLAEDFSMTLPDIIFDRLCWELQSHAGKYSRTHKDGSVEEGKTMSLILNTHHGKLFIRRD